jgi:hypothetical protein
MKKLLTSFLVLFGFLFPLLAQIDHDYNPNDRIPLINATITKDQIPAQVLKAFNTQFNENDQQTWSKFPFALKEYGWVYDVGAADLNLNRFEVTMKSKEGGDFWAVYAPNGELVETREASVNVAVPSSVMEALSQSKYKDWKIVGDKELIKYYYDGDKKSVEQHFRVTVEKDNVRRSISFNYQKSADKQ